MKLIESKAEYIPQEEGLEGVYDDLTMNDEYKLFIEA
jgi:hypothetical protein